MAIQVFTDLDMGQLAHRLKWARECAGLSQTQVAFRADLNLGNYNDLERGKRPGLRAATLYQLCQVLRISADYLLGLGETLPGHLVYDAVPTRSEAP